MQRGDLPAERYVNFTIQDIYYLVKVTDMLQSLSSSVTKPADLRQFFQGRYKSYKKFRDYLLSMFFLKVCSLCFFNAFDAFYFQNFKVFLIPSKAIMQWMN